MGFSFETGFGDVDPVYSSFGAGGYATVNTDVSYGSPDEQPSTPTGNGTGVFMTGGDSAGFWSTLQTGLNIVLARDQQKMTAVYPATMQPQSAVTVQASADRRLLMMLMLAGGVYLLVRQ